jgi:hypothetical protein
MCHLIVCRWLALCLPFSSMQVDGSVCTICHLVVCRWMALYVPLNSMQVIGPVYAIATCLRLITCALPGNVLQLLTRDPVGTSSNTVTWSPAYWHRRGACGKLLHRADSGCCIDCNRDVMSGNSCFDMSIFFVRKLLDCRLECDNFMLFCVQDFRLISIRDSFFTVTSYFLIWYLWFLEQLGTSLADRLAVSGSNCKSDTVLTAEICNFEGLLLLTTHTHTRTLCVTWCHYGSECQFPCCFLRAQWCTRLWLHKPNCRLHVNWRWQ